MTKNLLIVSGFEMSLGGAPDDKSWRADADSYWSLADVGEQLGYTVRLRECIEQWGGRPSPQHPVTVEDLRWATHIVVYSFGCASAWKLWFDPPMQVQGIPYELLVIVAGVPDIALLQFKPGLWHAPKFVKRVVNFDVQDEPISCSLKDCPHVNFGDSYDPTLHGVTIRCDNLFPAIMAPGEKHIGIKDHPLVLEAIANLLSLSGGSGLLPAGEGSPLPTRGGG